MRTQSGAALSETIIVMFVAIPLMFFIPMLGKLVDARQQAIGAARYAAWENVVSPSVAPAEQVQQRFFGERAIPISSNRVATTSHELWGDEYPRIAGLSGQTRIAVPGNTVQAHAEQPELGGVAGKLGQGVELSGKLLDKIGSRTEWSVNGDRLARAYVTAGVEANDLLRKGEQVCGSGLGGCLQEYSVVMVDGWAARDDQHAADRVRSFVPASVLHPVGKALANTFGRLPLIDEVELLENAFGHVDMDELPVDRRRGAPR